MGTLFVYPVRVTARAVMVAAVAAAAAAAVSSCRGEMPVQVMAGTVEAADETSLTLRNIAGDTTLRLILDEETSFDGGELVEGNAAEVRYRASRRGDELYALEVTADETYPDVMGHWATDARAELPVELELLPRGVLRQSLPPSLLRFDSWYVDAASGVDGRICITGEVVIEADSVERYPFTVGAMLTGDKHGDMLLVEGTSGPAIRLRRVER